MNNFFSNLKLTKADEKLIFNIRAYIIPISSIIILILVLIFMFIPGVMGIFNNISKIRSMNAQYDLIKSRISYFKSIDIPSNNSLISSAATLSAKIVPIFPTSAEFLNSVSSLIQSEGLKVIDSNAYTQAQADTTSNLPTGTKIVSMGFHVQGTSAQLMKFFSDALIYPQILNVFDIKIQGELVSSMLDDVTFSVYTYSLDPNDIANSVDMYNNLNIDYTPSYLINLY